MSDDFLHAFMRVGNERSVINEHVLSDQDGVGSSCRLICVE